MGKIPQYQRDKFVSSYVGAPQLDTEGMKIAESVGNAATNLAAIEAKRLGEQAQIRIDQQANNALLKYSLAYQQQAKDLQETYADNPGGYAEAVSSMGMSMQEEFQAKIPDERIRARFGNAANTVVKAGMGVSLNWAEEKEKANANTAWLDSLDIAAQTAGEQTSRMDFWDTLNSIATITASNPLATDKERAAYQEQAVNLAKDNYYRSRAIDDPINFIKEMDTPGNNTYLYQGADGKKHTLAVSAKEIAGYKALAKDAFENKRERDKFDQLINSSGKSFEMLDGYQKGKFGLAEVAQYEKAVSNDPNTTEVEKENAGLLLRIARSDIRKTGVIDFSKIAEVQGDYYTLKQKIKKKKSNLSKSMTELMQINNKALEMVNSGEMGLSEGLSLMKSTSGYITSILTGRGVSRRDPMSTYYKYMDTKVNKYEGITDGKKLGIRGEAYQEFVSEALKAEEQAMGAEVSEEKYKEIADQALLTVTSNTYPETLVLGETPNAVLTKEKGVDIINGGEVSEKLKASQQLQNRPKYIKGQKYTKNGVVYEFNGKSFIEIGE